MIQPSTCNRKPDYTPRNVSDLPKAVVKSFAQMVGNTVLGSVSNEWKRAVERTPDLANGEYPKKLSEIVAIALVRLNPARP